MYDSDVTDEEWELIKHHFDPTDNRGGARSKHAKRTIVNAIFYLNKTGVQWRLLPNEFPPWKTVYDHYRQWNRRGTWETVLDELNQLHRKKTVKTQPQVMA
ncbi:MAG: transposase [bacterium]